jgi:inhibitor of KinA sporulation pathway (predicted exonuclease)
MTTGLDGRRTVVVDLEATCWDARDPILQSRQRSQTEIIEIGAVLLDGTEPSKVLQLYVRPRHYPTLSAFCTELTGITQAQVDAAAPFPQAYRAFLEWCGGDGDLVFAAWGAFDDLLLRKECKRAELPRPRWTPRNVKAMFAARKGRMALGLALEAIGRSFEGRAHCGLDDARNVVHLLDWLAQDPGAPSTT